MPPKSQPAFRNTSTMRARPASRFVLPCLVVALAFALGCGGLNGSRSAYYPSPKLNDSSQVNKPTADSLAATFASLPPATPNRPVNMLACSAGGQYASFDAGVLAGWTATGTRPEFDVVTGISSGAILACYAFLGSKRDAQMTQFFCNAKDKDFFTYRPFISLLRTQSLASSKTLEDLVDRDINEEVLCEMRAAHTAGRRLYLATMNVRTRRACIWDVGAIACSGRPDAGALVRKVILAASSIPGVLPAVKFDVEVDGCRYVEEHVDGGPATQVFMRPGPDSQKTQTAGWLKGSNFYALAAGKLYPPELTDKLTFIKRVTTVLSASLYALYRAELMNLYAYCQASGMTFHSIAIPPDAEVPANSTTFDPKWEKKLFALGYGMACPTLQWRLTAPGTEPGEEEAPRGADQLLPVCGK